MTTPTSLLKEFRKFVLRGNVVDLAVAVVIGAAFTGLVNSFVENMLTPLISAFQGSTQFAESYFTINGSEFRYGTFLNQLVTFMLTAAVVFFLVVKPLNHLTDMTRRGNKTEDPSTQKCPECLGEIPVKARRCMHCSSLINSAKQK